MAAKTEPIGRAKTNVARTKSETRENFFKENFTTRSSCKLREVLPTLDVLARSGVNSVSFPSGMERPMGSSQVYSFSSVS